MVTLQKIWEMTAYHVTPAQGWGGPGSLSGYQEKNPTNFKGDNGRFLAKTKVFDAVEPRGSSMGNGSGATRQTALGEGGVLVRYTPAFHLGEKGM